MPFDLVTPEQGTETPQAVPEPGTMLEHLAGVERAFAFPVVVTAAILIDYLSQFIGWAYGFLDRCGGSHHEFDCSGLQCKGTNGTGLTNGLCTTSFVLAQRCTAAGGEMTEAEATANDGPEVWWAFHGADHGRVDDGSKPNGASGHVVLVVRIRDANGNTVGFYTIEAMGHAYGVVRGTFENRGWTGHYRIPGVVDTPAPPKVKPMFNPSKQLAARLYDAGTGGWFEGYTDGTVDYLPPGTPGQPAPNPVQGGMVSASDRQAFAGRTLSRLNERWFIRHKGTPQEQHVFGFTIVATSGETYVPEAQH